jgi:MoaA/NifB/PqqE/SkfB family radical SAM enzyme
MVVTTYSIDDLLEFVEYASTFIVPNTKKRTRVVFRPLTTTLNYEEGIVPEDNAVNRKKLKDAGDLALDLGLEVETFDFDMNKDNQATNLQSQDRLKETIKNCTLYKDYAYIGSDGNIGLCCYSRMTLGNLKDNTLEEIRNSDKFLEVVDCISRGDLKYCSNCRKEG